MLLVPRKDGVPDINTENGYNNLKALCPGKSRQENEWKGFVSVILSYTLSKLTSHAVKHGKSVTSIGHCDKKSY